MINVSNIFAGTKSYQGYQSRLLAVTVCSYSVLKLPIQDASLASTARSAWSTFSLDGAHLIYILSVRSGFHVVRGYFLMNSMLSGQATVCIMSPALFCRSIKLWSISILENILLFFLS
jgi:hypothetical protein